MPNLSLGALLVALAGAAVVCEMLGGLWRAWREPRRAEALALWRDGTALPLALGCALQAPLAWALLTP